MFAPQRCPRARDPSPYRLKAAPDFLAATPPSAGPAGPHRYSQRLYARNMQKPYDVWKQHGGTSVSRVRLPARLEDGEGAQVLVRRSGKIVRDGRPDLRFHQYEIGPCEAGAQDPEAKVQVLYHCWRQQQSSSEQRS